MRPLAFALVLLVLCSLASQAAAAPGDLDETFSGDGFVVLNDDRSAESVAVQPDGAVVVVGAARVARTSYLWVARFNTAGRPDPAFSDDGETILPLGAASSSSSVATDVSIGSDGSIVVGGYTVPDGGEPSGVLVRLTRDGSVDQSFGSQGVDALSADQPEGFYVNQVAIDSDQTVLAGSDGTIARVLADGSLDPSFSEDGLTSVESRLASAIAVTPDGSVVVGGPAREDEDGILGVSRLRPNGELDPGFGDGGTAKVVIDPYVSIIDYQTLDSLAIGPTGEVVVGGAACEGVSTGPDGSLGSCSPLIVRLSAQGAPRITPDAIGTDVVIDAQGRLSVAGGTVPGRGLGEAIAVRRFGADDVIDSGFGRNGTGLAYLEQRVGDAYDIAVGSDSATTVLASVGSSLGDHSGNIPTEHLVRFEGLEGRRDLDGDQRRDEQDRCDLFRSSRPSGCPPVKRHVRLGSGRLGGALFGYVTSADPCAAKELVKLWRATPGGDRLIATLRTLRYAKFALVRPFQDGRYYATLPRHLQPGFGVCAKARSRIATLEASP